LAKDYTIVGQTVQYTHHLVPDFLERPQLRAKMGVHLQRFDVIDAISQMTPADIRINVGIVASYNIPPVVRLRHEAGLDTVPYELFGAVDRGSSPEMVPTVAGLGGGGQFKIQAPGFGFADWYGIYLWGDGKFIKRLTGLIYLCTWVGSYGYPLWKILNDPSTTDSIVEVALLAFTVFSRQRVKETDYAVLDLLLEKSFLLPPRPDLASTFMTHELPKTSAAANRMINLFPFSRSANVTFQKLPELDIWECYLTSKCILHCHTTAWLCETNLGMRNFHFRS
jgi:hypothetical protein